MTVQTDTTETDIEFAAPKGYVSRVYRDFGSLWVELRTDEFAQSTYRFLEVEVDHIDADSRNVMPAKKGTHYPSEKPAENVPQNVIDAMKNNGYTVVANIESGWENWEGRPEWSDYYVDTSNAVKV